MSSLKPSISQFPNCYLIVLVRREIHIPTAFLATIVRAPYKDDLGKLKRILKHIRSIIYLPLIMQVEELSVEQRNVDDYYATHNDFRGHTGEMGKIGQGMVLIMS